MKNFTLYFMVKVGVVFIFLCSVLNTLVTGSTPVDILKEYSGVLARTVDITLATMNSSQLYSGGMFNNGIVGLLGKVENTLGIDLGPVWGSVRNSDLNGCVETIEELSGEILIP